MRWSVALLVVAGAIAGCLADDEGAPPVVDDVPTDDAVMQLDGTPVVTGATPHFVYSGFTGAEPNIGITSSGSIFMTAFEDTIRSQDGGESWQPVYHYGFLQGLTPIGTSDPMLWVDPITDRVFTNHMLATACFNMIWSDDDGDTWLQRDMACIIPVVDHQKVMTAPPGPELNPQATLGLQLYPNVLYTCYNALLGNQCFASFDGGLTYTQEAVTMGGVGGGAVPVIGVPSDCAGVGGHPAAAPDGTIAVAAGWNCGPVVSHSRDSGLTWTAFAGPQEYGVGASIDPDLTFTPDGTMYLFYRDGEHMARVARSSDFGASWDAVWNITAPGLTSTRFHVLSAGDDGRIAMAYLGTDQPRGTEWDNDGTPETWTGAPIDAPPQTTWHLYIVTGEDTGGAPEDARFTAYRVTPRTDPVQVGCAWEGGGGGGPRACRNMLDFIDSAVAPDGTFYVTYTEGCTLREQCAPLDPMDPPDEMDSRDREVAVAWLEGWSLHAS